MLPHSDSQQYTANDALPEEEKARRARGRAHVAFQHVTKETDDRIAQAYVALADDSDSGSDVLPLKDEGEKLSRGADLTNLKRTLEERAVDRYLDDDEWERQERAEGRGVHIQRFPIGGLRAGIATTNFNGKKSGWWQRWGRYA